MSVTTHTGSPIARPYDTAATAVIDITFEVSIGGLAPHHDALELIDRIHSVVDEFDSAAVRVRSRPLGRAVAPRRPAIDDPVGPQPGRVQVFPEARAVRVAGHEVSMTRIEFDLLLFLAEHPRQVFTRQQLLECVWGHQHTGDRTVDVHIRRLRAGLGNGVVTTVRGVGYRLSENAGISVVRDA
jgi:DNA-binding response OmpR family regulator